MLGGGVGAIPLLLVFLGAITIPATFGGSIALIAIGLSALIGLGIGGLIGANIGEKLNKVNYEKNWWKQQSTADINDRLKKENKDKPGPKPPTPPPGPPGTPPEPKPAPDTPPTPRPPSPGRPR